MEKNMALLLLVIFVSSPFIPVATSSQYNISAFFGFGDSTIDPGNNNGLMTLVRSDHPPYGRDFNGSAATGRFSNGMLIPDLVASSLGLKTTVPAYLDPAIKEADLATGVTFASAGSGLDDFTATSVGVITMEKQIENFQQCLDRLKKAFGSEEVDQKLGNALFTISAATNDLVWNFYDLPTRKVQYNISGYHDFLLQNLHSLVEKLHSMGAQKLLISGLPPIGCLPMQRMNGTQRLCINEQNEEAKAYNVKLQGLIDKMVGELSGAKIAYMDIYNPLMDMMQNPQKYGFEETTHGCCGTGIFEFGPLCNFLTPTCPDASKFMFWDAIHPSQATYQAVADYIMKTVLPKVV